VASFSVRQIEPASPVQWSIITSFPLITNKDALAYLFPFGYDLDECPTTPLLAGDQIRFRLAKMHRVP
jgi:hypothetical protein